ncbi:hypothetical protein P886_0342 [Alteromonadaceae bacterium 2753L.S.0a.02]|nr:hypothetical protein P886_0342 [Alteromonadaceae bacterium 2753L.S.0a.02]
MSTALKTAITIIALAISASTFSQTMSYQESYSASRFNTAGTSYSVMRPHANHFCYLSSISFEETDGGGEEATCRIRRSGTVWVLEAKLDQSNDADAECNAVCYKHL